MSAKNNRVDKQKGMFQVGGIFVFLTVVALFFIFDLGGEDSEGPREESVPMGLNVNMPDPGNVFSSEGKMEAVRKEQGRLDRERTQMTAQSASFDMLQSLSAPKETPVRVDVENLLDKIEDEPMASGSGTSGLGGEIQMESRPSSQAQMDVTDRRIDSLKQEVKKVREKEASRRVQYGLGTKQDSLLLNMKSPVKEEKITSSNIIEPAPSRRNSSGRGFPVDKLNEKGSKKGDICAVIHGNQPRIRSSSQVKIRLCEPIELEGVVIPRNTIVDGTATFTESRVDIVIKGVKYQNRIYAFNGVVYDQDTRRGLYTGRNLVNEAARESASDSYSRSMGSGLTGVVSNVVDKVGDRFDDWRRKVSSDDHVDLPANYKIFIKME